MASRHWLVFGFALALLGGITPARAQAPASAPPAPSQPAPSGPVYVVTYFDVAPGAARKTAGLLRQFTAATRKEDDNAEILALHEAGRPGRFAIVEAWRDKAALDAHGAAMKALGEKLQAGLITPFDFRQFATLSVAGPAANTEPKGVVYGLTHVDVFPAGKDQVAALVKALVDSSRKDAGALRFDALVWDGHPNHFHLIEAWASRNAREAHILTDQTRQFRAKLAPFEGALYDERLYEAVR
jgi:quinol monooxygenase YgiN